MSKSDQLWCLVTGLNLVQVFNRFLSQNTLIASTIDCQLSLEYNEPIITNQITFIVTSPQHKCLGEWNSWERAPESAEKTNKTIYI